MKKFLLTLSLLLSALNLHAQVFPPTQGAAVTTNSLGSLLLGYNIPSGISVTISSGGTLSNSGLIAGPGTFDFIGSNLSFSAQEIPQAALNLPFTMSGTGTLEVVGSPIILGSPTIFGSPTITGNGTLTINNFSLTIPATGVAALLGTSQTFSNAQTITASGTALTLFGNESITGTLSVSSTATINGLLTANTFSGLGSASFSGSLDLRIASITWSANEIPFSALPANVGTVTSVTLSGGTTGLTFTEANPTTTPSATASGVLVVGNGGTGTSSLGTGLVTSPGSGGALSGTNSINQALTITVASGTALTLNGNLNITGGITTSSTIYAGSGSWFGLTSYTTNNINPVLEIGGGVGPIESFYEQSGGAIAWMGVLNFALGFGSNTTSGSAPLLWMDTSNGVMHDTGLVTNTASVTTLTVSGATHLSNTLGIAYQTYTANSINPILTNDQLGSGSLGSMIGLWENNASTIAWMTSQFAISFQRGYSTTASAPNWWMSLESGVEHPAGVISGSGSFTTLTATSTIYAGTGLGFSNSNYLANSYNGMMNVIPGYGLGYFQNNGAITWANGADAVAITDGVTTTTSAPLWWVEVQTGIEHSAALKTGMGTFTGVITSTATISAGAGNGFNSGFVGSTYAPMVIVAAGTGLEYLQNSGGIGWLGGIDAIAILSGSTSTASPPNFWVGVQNGVTHTTGVVTTSVSAVTATHSGNTYLGTTSIGGLPAANTVSYSYRTVTDSTTSLGSATIGTTPTGSGSYSVPVWSNGTVWLIH